MFSAYMGLYCIFSSKLCCRPFSFFFFHLPQFMSTLNWTNNVFSDSSYDFAFVDAEKKMYQDYFELLLQLVSSFTS